MEVNSNAREYEPRPALATGGGVLGKIECCNIVLREEGRCTSHRVDPCGGGCRQNGERIKMMFVLEFAPSQVVALLSTYILKLNFVMLWVRLINPSERSLYG